MSKDSGKVRDLDTCKRCGHLRKLHQVPCLGCVDQFSPGDERVCMRFVPMVRRKIVTNRSSSEPMTSDEREAFFALVSPVTRVPGISTRTPKQ